MKSFLSRKSQNKGPVKKNKVGIEPSPSLTDRDKNNTDFDQKEKTQNDDEFQELLDSQHKKQDTSIEQVKYELNQQQTNEILQDFELDSQGSRKPTGLVKQEEPKPIRKRVSTSFFDDQNNIRQSILTGQHQVENQDVFELEK